MIQIGDILQTVASTPTSSPQTVSELLLSPTIIVKLVFLSFLSLAPILGRRRLQNAFLGPNSAQAAGSQEPSFEAAATAGAQPSRGTWSHVVAWRSRLRTKLGGHEDELVYEQRKWERELREKELAELVQEKRRVQSEEDGVPSRC